MSENKNVRCGVCRGKGYILQDNDLNVIEITDCSNCFGKGIIEIRVQDLRQASKSKRLYLPEFW